MTYESWWMMATPRMFYIFDHYFAVDSCQNQLELETSVQFRHKQCSQRSNKEPIMASVRNKRNCLTLQINKKIICYLQGELQVSKVWKAFFVDTLYNNIEGTAHIHPIFYFVFWILMFAEAAESVQVRTYE